ncbi:MAG: metallophosphoesterase [Planctomycetaceae bacterium]|jgi:predicted phosphodiesterase|nr:metallophosphoesterase [Planctomycetaceae bacterium]MBP60774.1 metallophosphoesterase [Planctomycetaceae bacterium]
MVRFARIHRAPNNVIHSSTTSRIACLGGIYNNYLALEVAIRDARKRGVDAIYCLGDMGAFGPHPDRVFPLLSDHDVICLQGNYDHSIGNELNDCQCGYTDPRDNYFAQISYDYTLQNTSVESRQFLRDLPTEICVDLGPLRLLLCHGSPRRVNEFLWASTSPNHFLEHLAAERDADVVAVTHTGIKWHRPLADNRHFVNVGVLGRPENDGNQHVWYTLLETSSVDPLRVKFVPVEYDYHRLAREMGNEGIPAEFIETVQTGWWTTCLEILPAKERKQGRW